MISFIILIQILVSCSDQIESKYETYDKAIQDNYFEKGWIPQSLIYPSMTAIYQIGNLDVNSCIFSFKLSKKDFQSIKSKIHTFSSPSSDVSGIDFPKLWLEGYHESINYIYIQERDTIHIGLNEKNWQIFGYYQLDQATIR